MTSNIRTVCHIESAVREHANRARDPQEDYPEPTNGCPVAWRMELLERLRALDVCGFQPATLMSSKPPQEDPGPSGTLETDPTKHVQRSVDEEPLKPASVVCSYLALSTPYSLLIIYSSYTTSTLFESDRESDESSFIAPAKGLSSGERALHRLISGPHPQGELASLIETVFSSRKAIDLAGFLQESDAQTFIDVVHEVRFRPSIPEEWAN